MVHFHLYSDKIIKPTFLKLFYRRGFHCTDPQVMLHAKKKYYDTGILPDFSEIRVKKYSPCGLNKKPWILQVDFMKNLVLLLREEKNKMKLEIQKPSHGSVPTIEYES